MGAPTLSHHAHRRSSMAELPCWLLAPAVLHEYRYHSMAGRAGSWAHHMRLLMRPLDERARAAPTEAKQQQRRRALAESPLGGRPWACTKLAWAALEPINPRKKPLSIHAPTQCCPALAGPDGARAAPPSTPSGPAQARRAARRRAAAAPVGPRTSGRRARRRDRSHSCRRPARCTRPRPRRRSRRGTAARRPRHPSAPAACSARPPARAQTSARARRPMRSGGGRPAARAPAAADRCLSPRPLPCLGGSAALQRADRHRR